MERFLAIVNPLAGFGRCAKLAPEALSRLREAGVHLDVVETDSPGHATRIARQSYAEGRRDFIAVGGDGTAFEIVDGLFPEACQGPRAALGFLPCGTGNSFLRDFAWSGLEHAIQGLVRGWRRPCDVIRLTHGDGMLHYINVMSIGFAADVCTLANRRFKRLGAAAYGLGVIATLSWLRSYTFPLGLDSGETWDRPTTLISFCNSRYTGGAMMMAPDADTADGQLDVVLANRLGRMELLGVFPRIFRGTHLAHPAVQHARTRWVQFDVSEKVGMAVDGEVLQHIPKRLEVLERALDVRV